MRELKKRNIMNLYTASAMFVYYQIFYPQLSYPQTKIPAFCWGYYIAKRLRGKKFIITNDLIAVIQFLVDCNYTSHKKEIFLAEARHFILSSHKWDWVPGYLQKFYPQLNIGELYDEEIKTND